MASHSRISVFSTSFGQPSFKNGDEEEHDDYLFMGIGTRVSYLVLALLRLLVMEESS